MAITLPALPWADDALEPYISKETISYHYGKHHQAYVTNLNKLIDGTPLAELSLEAIMQQNDGGIYNNAAQVWNHTFYWNSLAPHTEGTTDNLPSGALAAAIEAEWGDFASFKEQFTQAAATQFGSGWAWLVQDSSGKLSVISTSNADNPLKQGLTPLLTCDVWEHAYYIDTRNARPKYIENFWHLVNWDFVAANLA